jgi:hypothetical protein
MSAARRFDVPHIFLLTIHIIRDIIETEITKSQTGRAGQQTEKENHHEKDNTLRFFVRHNSGGCDHHPPLCFLLGRLGELRR